MSEWKSYRKVQTVQMRAYQVGENTDWISISPEDVVNGSPKLGDMIAKNPKNEKDQWLVSEKFFKENYEGV